MRMIRKEGTMLRMLRITCPVTWPTTPCGMALAGQRPVLRPWPARKQDRL